MAGIALIRREQLGGGGPRGRRRLSRQERKRLRDGYLFISPVLLGLFLWVLGPMFLSLYYSFTNYNVIQAPQVVGTANYRSLLADSTFLHSFEITVIYAAVSVPCSLAIGLAIALLLHRGGRGIRFYRTIFYIPAVIPIVAGAELWTTMLTASPYGVVNYVLMHLHLISKPFEFFSSPNTALFSLLLMTFWGSAGGSMIIWLAALQSVPDELVEAARVDGAGPIRRFWSVVLPLITPTIFFNLVLGMITALQTFASNFVISGGDTGAPLGSLDFVNIFIYRTAFGNFQMGMASAAAWLMFVVILVLTLIVFRTSRRWVFYMGSQR
ncbi:MAG TPA: sugar ABC transporter permease [Streptosporangiaceae bacterium]|nr:sugar ABC transporter permease [Streptosporangiaceae bacterium]